MLPKSTVLLPDCGYWSRIQPGQKTYKPPLRQVKAGASETVFILQSEGPREKSPTTPALEPEVAKAIDDERLERNVIVIPEHIAKLHPEVLKIADAWTTCRTSWNEKAAKCDRIELRRRRILHAFFRAIEARKGSVATNPYDSGFEVALLQRLFPVVQRTGASSAGRKDP